MLLVLSLITPLCASAEEVSQRKPHENTVSNIQIQTPKNGSTFYYGNSILIHFKNPNAWSRKSPVTVILQSENRSQKPITIAMGLNSVAVSWKVPRIPEGNYVISVRSMNSTGSDQVSIQIKERKVVEPPQNPSVTVSSPVAQVPTMQYQTNSIDGNQNVPLVAAALSTNASGTVRSVSVTVAKLASVPWGTLPTTLYLSDRRTGALIASRATGFGQVIFDNLSISVPPGMVSELLVSADMPSNTLSGTTISGSITSVTLSSGRIGASSLPIHGASMTFVGSPSAVKGVYVSAGDPTIRIAGVDQQGNTTSLAATFPYQVTAMGGDVAMPVVSDFSGYFITPTGESVRAEALNVVVIPNSTIKKGTTSQVTVTLMQYGRSLTNGIYTAKLLTPDEQTTTIRNGVNVVRPVVSGSAVFAPAISKINTVTGQNGSTTQVTATFNFNLSAMGGDVPKPVLSDVQAYFVRGQATVGGTEPIVVADSVSIVTVPDGVIRANTTSNVSVSMTHQGSTLLSGLYSAKLVIKSGTTTQTYVTPDAVNVNGFGAFQYSIGNQKASVFDTFGSFIRSLFGF